MSKRPRITLYSSAHCAHCRRARDFLRQHRIPFREAPIDTNRRAFIEFKRLGASGVPVILVGDQRLDGFDPRRWTALLGRTGIYLK